MNTENLLIFTRTYLTHTVSAYGAIFWFYRLYQIVAADTKRVRV
jgi:hypothetical protein